MSEKTECIIDYIREHQSDMYRFAYSYVKNREDALDIIQEAVIKAIKNADGIRDISRVKPWIFKIIANEAYILLRNNKKYINDIDIEELEQKSTSEAMVNTIKDTMAEYIDRQTILKEIMSLDGNYRMIIILRYFENMQIREIGNVLGLSQNTVKARLYKALNILKRKLGEDGL